MRSRRLSKRELERFELVPRTLAEHARVRSWPWLPRQAGAMTIGHTILVRPGREDDEALLAHELVHVRQWAELGPVGFLARYLGAYFRNLARLRNHMAAYRAIPLEAEARAAAEAWHASQP